MRAAWCKGVHMCPHCQQSVDQLCSVVVVMVVVKVIRVELTDAVGSVLWRAQRLRYRGLCHTCIGEGARTQCSAGIPHKPLAV